MLRCCAIALALRGSGLLRGLIPPPVSCGLGGRTFLFVGSFMPPPVLGFGRGFGVPIDGRPAIALDLRRVLAIAFCLETFVRLINFLPISFRKILLPLVFQSLQQQSCPSCTGTIEAFAPIVEIHEIQYLPFPE